MQLLLHEANVRCCMCSASVYYRNDDQLQLLDHLRSEHNVEADINFIVGGCLMNGAEREAVFNVVKDREPNVDRSKGPIEADTSSEDISTVSDIAIGAPEVVNTNTSNDDNDESGASDLSVSQLLVPETTLQEGTELLREVGECSPPTIEDAMKAVVEFPCPECDRTFDLKIKLNRHLKLHTKKNDAKAMLFTTPVMKVKSEPGSTSTPYSAGKRQPKNHIEPPEGEGFPCPDCGKRFTKKTAMLRHQEDLHQPGEFPCRGCGKMFSSKNKLSSHYSRNCKKRETM